MDHTNSQQSRRTHGTRMYRRDRAVRLGASAAVFAALGLFAPAVPLAYADPDALDAAASAAAADGISPADLAEAENIVRGAVDFLHLQSYEYPGMVEQTAVSLLTDANTFGVSGTEAIPFIEIGAFACSVLAGLGLC